MKSTICVLVLVALCVSSALAQDGLVPSITPLKGKTIADVTRSFGKSMHPSLKIERDHNGVDIPAPVGTDVLATADGVVALVGKNEAEGRFVQIKHADNYVTRYTHLSKLIVKKGQRVKQGARIALSGNTGMSSGAHLHYEILHYGKPVDPMTLLASQ